VRPTSLRGRLLWLLLPALALAWMAAAIATYFDAHREVDALLDAHLRQSARLLAAQAELDFDEIDVDDEDDADEDRYGREVAFQVRRADGILLVRSPNAPHEPLARSTRGFSETHDRGRTWRVYTLSTDHGAIVVHFAEDHVTRERIARRLALRALAPILVALPLLGLLLWWVAGRSLRPLARIGEAISRRGPDDLSPVSGGVIPSELRPLVHRLDDLLERLRDSLDSERRFTSHAAHELRTPVAALRAQAEVAATARDPAVREAALAHCIEACDRMTRLVSQLLLLARADETGSVGDAQPCRLDEIARTVLAQCVPEATRANITVSLESAGDAVVQGDATLLETLVRNLVDNAVRHGGGEARVGLRHEPGAVVLEVADDGPGVPPETLSQLGRRFYRVPGSTATGSGLGLSIVMRIAELHGARVRYESRPAYPGMCITVTFPA
jgi:two-component system sensor histidine kinase QseC